MGKALTQRDAAEFERCLAGGGVAVFPADTVYGLACDPGNERAVAQLYALKGRPADRPAAVMFFDLASALAALPDLGPQTVAALKRLLPGPVALILLNPDQLFPLVCGPQPKHLGIRVPELGRDTRVLAQVRHPVLQSSANRSREPAVATVAEIPREIRAGADLVLDAGTLPGTASTVIDLTAFEESRSYRIVRAGALTETAVADRLSALLQARSRRRKR